MKFALSNQSIDEIGEFIAGFLDEYGTDKKEALRLRLMYEEILLKYRDAFGEDCGGSIEKDKRLGQSRLIIKIGGAPLNPFETENDANGIVNRMVAGLGIVPSWSYADGKNRIMLVLKKKRKRSMVKSMVIAVSSAIVLGIVSNFLPETVQSALCNYIATPISSIFLHLVTSLSGPLVFLSVLCGIYSIGDTATFGKIGKTMIGRFIFMTVLATTIALVLCSFFFTIETGSTGTADFSSLVDILVNIVPNNLFTPFTENNPLQIIFVAVILGIAMIFLGNSTASAAKFAYQLNEIVQLIMTYVSKLIPAFVFISIYSIIVTDKISVIAGVYKPIILVFAANMLCLAIYVVSMSAKRKLNAGTLVKKIMPVFIGGITTASSAAVFGLNSDTCKNKLGIDKSLVDFGIPLGQVLFMPGVAGAYFVVGLALCQMYGVTILLQNVIILFVISVVLAVAAPPIPGGSLTCYSIVIAQMGVPADAIAVCVTMDVIFDFLETGVNLFALETQLTVVADKLGMLDRDILTDKNNI